MPAPADPLHERDLAAVLARRVADRPDKTWIMTPAVAPRT